VSYIVLRFDVDACDADAWSEALLDAGALAVDVSDPHAGTPSEMPVYAEPGGPGQALWPVSRLSALFVGGIDAPSVMQSTAHAVLREVPSWQAAAVAEQDWVRATQAQFGPLRVASNFWIVPTWCEPPDPAAINLRLDPGVAFGTGSHPTTRLCLSWLRVHVAAGDAVLDYGCGSGILAIASARLGAARIAGVDIDPQALAAAAANARVNGVHASFVAPDALRAGRFDVVVANILSGPLLNLAPALAARVRAGGRIALSGILDAQAADVAGAYARWFNIAPWCARDGWTLLAGVRRTDPQADPAP
jgi:ribosomal protein L11 methyltransferase